MLLLCVCSESLHGQDRGKRVTWGLSERLRFVSWDNAVTLDESQDGENTFTRHRTSAWVDWKPGSAVSVRVKLTNEFRYYFQPERELTIHELFFDNFYVQWRNRRGPRFDLTLGRQNIMLGEGFVVMDGHPLDGSRSIYFNAARLDLLLGTHQRLILFGVAQPRTDDLLPVVNDQEQPLVEQPEQGAGIYYTGSRAGISLDGYLIRKIMESTNASPVSESVTTAGLRLGLPLTGRLSLTAEGALQRGDREGRDQRGWGGYLHADYTIPDRSFLKSITLGGIALSGDDPATTAYEEWNPLFSRWPKWSESYIYTLIREKGGRVAWWSNFTSVYTSLAFRLCGRADLTATYHRLGAFHDMAYLSSIQMGRGTVRGDLIIVKADFRINRVLNGHVLYETFTPGSFYSGRADRYGWFRVEVNYVIQE